MSLTAGFMAVRVKVARLTHVRRGPPLVTPGLYSPCHSPGQSPEWGAFPFSKDLPSPGVGPRSPTLQTESLPAEPPGSSPWMPLPPKRVTVQTLNVWICRLPLHRPLKRKPPVPRCCRHSAVAATPAVAVTPAAAAHPAVAALPLLPGIPAAAVYSRCCRAFPLLPHSRCCCYSCCCCLVASHV